MATIQDLYQQILGRAPDPSGLAYWQSQFGDTVSPEEVAAFRLASQPELATSGYQPSYSSLQEKLQAENPSAYNAIKNVAQQTASSDYGGQLQDYQFQIFTPINTNEVNAPKQIKFSDGLAQGARSLGTDPDTGEQLGYVSNQSTLIHGIPVVATYDATGKLTGYTQDPNTPKLVTGTGGKAYVSGQWDASGNPNPQKGAWGSGGGFFGGAGNVLAGLALGYFGGGALADALGGEALGLGDLSATDTSLGLAGEANAAANLGTVPNIGTVPTPYPPIQVADVSGGLPSTYTGQGLTQTTGANLPNMGGAQGLQSGITTGNLADMGGGQGLTTIAAGTPSTVLGQGGTALSSLTSGLSPALQGALGAGTAIGALGANTGVTPTTISDIGTTGLASGTGSLLGTGLASGVGSALGAGGANTGGLLGLGNLPTGLLTGLGASALGNVAGTLINTKGIQDAINAINTGVTGAQGTLKDIYTQQQGFAQPYRDVGQTGLSAITANMPYFQHQFNAEDLAKGLAPNYDFMLQQGQMANQRAANLGGGALGGNALQGLNQFTQNYAGNAYQNAFQNYQAQRQNIYNTLAGIAGIGQKTTSDLMSAGGTYGKNLSDLQAAQAKAMADAQVAMAQQNASAAQSLGNTGLLAGLLSQNPNVGGSTLSDLLKLGKTIA